MANATNRDNIEAQLQQAMQAEREGNRLRAKNILNEIVREHPEDERGWFALATLEEDFHRRLSYLERALAANPDNHLVRQMVEAMRPPTKAEGIELNPGFRRALAAMNDTHNHVLVTGKAGTGKSTLLKYFVDHTDKQIAVLAYTGMAAVNVGGQTIHSFFKFPLGPLNEDDIETVHDGLYKHLETIVIDEVSMLRADLMDAIDLFLRKNGPDKNRPFGGVQVIFVGDPFQLEPVVGSSEEAQYLATKYSSPWFFDARVFKEVFGPSAQGSTIVLDKTYRHTDPGFIELHVPVEWLKAILHQRFVVLLHGRVPAGFDLQGLTVKDNIQVKGKKVILHLPPPQVFEENVSIDFNNSRILYVSSQCLFFCTESAEIYQRTMLPEAQKRLVEAALKNDILRQAATYGKNHYEALLRSPGFEDVTVVVIGYKL